MAVFEQQSIQTEFFDYLFSKDVGYVCISTIRAPYERKSMHDTYFEWPKQRQQMLDHIDKVSGTHNVYFCVSVLSIPKRKNENAIPANRVWADLDTCSPDILAVPPQCILESSPSRFQAIWRLDRKIDSPEAQQLSKRIAYAYHEQGADLSGHDPAQLLRVPGTFNYKYELDDVPEVKWLTRDERLLAPEIFDTLPEAEDSVGPDELGLDMPEIRSLPNADSVIYSFRDQLRETAFARYFSEEPADDWSKPLWRLVNTCIEAGMSAEEAFSVARSAKCNKYARDNRPESHLWREVVKAELQQKKLEAVIREIKPLRMPDIISADDEKLVGDTIIHTYREWACEATDAIPEYHELSCAILLSALMAGGIRLKLSHSTMVPNLWGLVLGESTLTRKTTAMDMAMDFLAEIDHDTVVSTDGSAEGLLTALSQRPKMVSIYYRDEVSGFFDAIRKKEYLAALPEILTKLYDVPKFYKRTLRKETISLVEPVFIFFGGGVREKTYFLLEEDFLLSGFIPRFLVVNGYADIENLKPAGPPPDEIHDQKRPQLLSTFQALHKMYSQAEIPMQVGGETLMMPSEIDAKLTKGTWDRFNEAMDKLMKAANDAPNPNIALPCLNRLGWSILKLAVLIGASRQEPDANSQIEINERDFIQAAHFGQKWGRHTIDLINNTGQTKDEAKIRSVYKTIEAHPGINRGLIMRYHHLNARMMDVIEQTLEQRLELQIVPKGKMRIYYPIGR